MELYVVISVMSNYECNRCVSYEVLSHIELGAACKKTIYVFITLMSNREHNTCVLYGVLSRIELREIWTIYTKHFIMR